jgi:mRNA interferase HigB
MWVISRKKLIEVVKKHGGLAGPLDAWYRVTRQASWKNLRDIRQTWSSTDQVGSCNVFNIKGDEYRLISWINFKSQKVFLRHVLTHAEYNKEAWKSDCTGH